jgi:hypothetical protein
MCVVVKGTADIKVGTSNCKIFLNPAYITTLMHQILVLPRKILHVPVHWYTHAVTHPQIQTSRWKCAKEVWMQSSLFPSTGKIGSILGCIFLATFLFSNRILIRVRWAIIQSYYIMNFHTFFLARYYKLICTVFMRVGEWSYSATHASPRH